MKEGRRKKYEGKKRAGRGRGMEGFPLLNQKQLSEGRQFGKKCCFTLRAAFQIVFTIYTTKAKACKGRQDSILFARINIMPVHSCMQQHFFFFLYSARSNAGNHFYNLHPDAQKPVRTVFPRNESSKNVAVNQTQFGVLILHRDLTGRNNSTSQSNA